MEGLVSEVVNHTGQRPCADLRGRTGGRGVGCTGPGLCCSLGICWLATAVIGTRRTTIC